MTLWQLILREIRLRWISFVLGVASVLVAVAVLTAQLTILDAHDMLTRQILAEKQAETEAEMGRMEDDYRKIMKGLGFNLLILPADQSLEEFYAQGYVTRDMPEQFATELAGSGIMTINHLVPSLERRVRWPEQGQRPVILVGTRGEVPLAGGKPEEPMMVPVPPGSAVVGDEIRRSLGLKIGDSITLLGQKFVVSSCQPERGTRDDITIWIDLSQAQRLLGAEGRINSILALKCQCEGSDVASIRREVGRLLPGVQVIELASKALARTEARDRAAAAAKTAIEADRAHRARMRRERESFAAWLLPLVTLGAAVWIGLLAFMNVRERTPEIGILRALGLRSRQIITIFVARAALAGLVGAVLGYGVGFAVGLLSGETAVGGHWAAALFKPGLLGLVALAAPMLAALASLSPAVIAARHDPAAILRDG